MTDTAVRLIGPLTLSNVAATLYTVPANTTTVLRHAVFSKDSSGNAEVWLSFGVDGSTTRVISGTTVFGEGGVLDWSGFQVLEAGEVIQARCSVDAVVNLTVSGVEVTP